MNIYLAISHFYEAGGSEEPFTTLAIGLRKQGHHVTVFSRHSVSAQNQYVRRLFENHIPVVAWHPLIVRLASDWQFQDRVVKFLLSATSPLLAPVALLVALVRSTGIRQAWVSVVGHWRGILTRLIHRDRKDELLLAALNWSSLWRRPDIIHVYRSELTAAFGWAARKDISSVYSELSVPGELINREVWKWRSPELNKAAVVTAISKASADGLREVAGIKRPIVIIPPVVIAPEQAPPSSHNDNLTVTYIGRLSPEKGISYLLLAAKHILEARAFVQILIAGGGELKESLIHQAQELGIIDRTSFCGLFPGEELPKIMARTDILVLPSLSEGMPFVIVEAMAYGKPVVASAVGGIPEVVEDEKTGLLVPPREADRLAQALLRLIDDRDRREQMGRAGRQKFLGGGFSLESFIAANLMVYRQALGLSKSNT